MNSPKAIEATIQIDPTFDYYLGRSEESVAAELELAGYRNVRYFVTDETKVNGRLIEALRKRGMTVWAMVLGNGAYSSKHLPHDWPEWQMTLIKPVADGFFRFSPFCYRYVKWKKNASARLVATYPFNGYEVAEPYFPEWNGLESGVYGDIGPYARAAFKRFSGSEMPDFRYPSSPRYYKKDTARYMLWVECRVQAVNGFLNELINGDDGVRSVRPDIQVATWSVAVDAGPEAAAAVREYQGIDAADMIRTVRPDVHVLQTHWPDWMKMRLPPDYVQRYQPFVRQIRASHPVIPLGVQTDIGSLRRMRRSPEWLKRYAQTADQCGYRFWTAYEYSIGLSMYQEPPVPMKVQRLGTDRILLEFNKRIDEPSAKISANYRCFFKGKELYISIAVQHVDGNLVVLQSAEWPARSLEIHVSGVKDTPEFWLLKGEPGHVTTEGCKIEVPDQ